ncbi:FAD binding domain-containing protein [Saccharata proteae CBS 121410]|uniref:L-ornithine N(5)-monooxygenase [NAD(P)H] n=1 Tax=Saccharata proteae CBS 121410 TaxID=1314787 RepID=A0A9P4HTT0_9PEZI|nr:FAD binding domain-containing protein [Saccharata proteae CBS 121410]
MTAPNADLCGTTVHDVIIIGAGPCGLAVAARLCEHTPSAVFTDEEHQRYHWIRKHGKHMAIKDRKNLKVKKADTKPGRKYSTLVLDGTAEEWMGRWNRLFKTFEIDHLRSPMFFHVDPGDRDALLAYTHEKNRDNELEELHNTVGKEISKHHKKKRSKTQGRKPQAEVVIDERDRKDYYTPSRPLFEEHCQCVVDRYGLREGLIKQEQVQDIEFGDVPEVSETTKVFSLQTDKGVHYARTVVLAIGPGNAPAIPGLTQQSHPHACHSMQIQKFPDPRVVRKMKEMRETNVMVIGGGLTSAQISDMAVRKGVTRVWHLMRGSCKVKPFDVDLAWMGKFRNLEQAYFWSANSDEERLEYIKTARNGGSITPKFSKILKQHMQHGRLSLHTHTQVTGQTFNEATQTWSMETSPAIPNLPPMDFIYYATGIQTDYSTLPLLKSMNKKYPIHGHGGLPCLNDDLMWKDGVPLFVTGRLAALRLGPGAANLHGARVGAERISWNIDAVLGNGDDEVEDDAEGFNYATGRGNRYQNLAMADDEELENETRTTLRSL